MAPKPILEKVIIKKQIKPADFLKFMPAAQKRELLKQAAFLRGKRVVHINATAVGGGVAEMLKSLIPYLRALGVESDWYSIIPEAGKDFFETTNKIHNALQGAPIWISGKEWTKYKQINRRIAAELDKMDCDILVINDPQPLLAGCYSRSKKPKIYFNHIDTSRVYEPVWKKLLPCVNSYQKIVFSNSDFINGDLARSRIKIFAPAIDPLTPKQKIVPKKQARFYLKKHGGIPANYPLMVQVSRFDIWKNPFGVIEAFRIVQNTYPKAQLVLVGFREAKDNPAAEVLAKDIAMVASRSREIFQFFDPAGKNILEFTNMAQNAADVIVQNSTKEGFGLTVSEAMWKRKPVVGGPASGIRKQITNRKNGFIAKNSEHLARKIVYLLSHPKRRKELGEAARKTVRQNFLFPRLVLDHLKLYHSVK